MPLEDVVSPVIAAFLAGRKAKQDKERFALQKRQEDDESKIRQQQAQKLAKEIAHFDKNAELEDQAKQINLKIGQRNLTKTVLDDIEAGRLTIPQVVKQAASEAAMTGDWNDELATPGMQGMLNRTDQMGNAPSIDLGGGMQFDTSNLPTREQIIANKVANQRAMLQPKVEEATALQGVKTAAQKDILGTQFKNQLALQDDKQLGDKEAAALTNTLQRDLQASREKAAKALADAHEAGANWRARLSSSTSIQNTRETIAAKKGSDIEHATALLESIKDGTISRQSIAQLDPSLKRQINDLAMVSKVPIFHDKQIADMQGISRMNTVFEKMDRVIKQIGNGSNTSFVPGSQGYQDYQALRTELGSIAREAGNIGALSDPDIVRTEGSIPDRQGQNVYSNNLKKMEDLKEIQVRIFNHYYPPAATDPMTRFKAGVRMGISPERLAIKKPGGK